MTIRYEANPPKILPDVDTNESIKKFTDKIKIISKKCDAIHLTENVLGFQRVSPIKVGKIIKEEISDLPITVSLRVRDKSEKEILEFVEKCKAHEDEDGYLKQGFFESSINTRAKFISGPFTNMIFNIISKQNNKLIIRIGNITTTISNRVNYQYRTA